VAGPEGSHITGTIGNLYTLQATDSTYETFPVSAALHGGFSYWAYFPSGGSLQMPSSYGSAPILAAPDVWQMIGNPSSLNTVQLSGLTPANGDVALGWDPVKGQYFAVTSLKVGQGAWAITQNGLTLTDPASTPPTAPTRPTPQPGPHPAGPTTAPKATATAKPH
jgi:hypothetical protein